MKASLAAALVLFTGCTAARRPPDLSKSLHEGRIEVLVQKMARPWMISEKLPAGAEGFELLSASDGLIGVTLHPAASADPFVVVFTAMMHFTERYPGSKIACERKNGLPAFAKGTLAFPEKPMRLEVRAWEVPGTDVVAVVTGLWPEGSDATWSQDYEAVCAGVRSAKKKR